MPEATISKFGMVTAILCGAFGVFLLYKTFKSCARKAMYRGRKFIDLPGIICIALFSLPLCYEALSEELTLDLGLSSTQLTLLFISCIAAAVLINFLRWGFAGGLGFSICHVCLAGMVAFLLYLAIIVIALLFAILAPTSNRVEGYWIGKSMFGDEFLVLSIGDDLYQDGNWNNYQKLSDDTMLGFDGSLYYIHRRA